jgi:hypothetical protein
MTGEEMTPERLAEIRERDEVGTYDYGVIDRRVLLQHLDAVTRERDEARSSLARAIGVRVEDLGKTYTTDWKYLDMNRDRARLVFEGRCPACGASLDTGFNCPTHGRAP